MAQLILLCCLIIKALVPARVPVRHQLPYALDPRHPIKLFPGLSGVVIISIVFYDINENFNILETIEDKVRWDRQVN